MSKNFKLLLFTGFFSISINALDMPHTNEILNNAIEATQTIQQEINEVLLVSPQAPIETFIPIDDIGNEDLNGSNIIYAPSIETETEIITVIQDENRTLIETPSPIISTPILIVESNISIPETQPIIEEKGNAAAGKNIFKYVLKTDCGINGHKFANKYSQEEWEEIAELNKFKKTLFETCPNVKNYYQDKWTVDLYKFFHEMSNDEDGIPEC